MFRSLLIANRGEIACRIVRSARALGVRTTVVCSSADRAARHVRHADAAIEIGPADAARSYLDVERVIEAARAAGADALHPGYGFLSENAALAEACVAHGVQFVGPPGAAIRAMGDKDAAKRAMHAAGVPVVPGVSAAELDPEQCLRAAHELGFPVLLKAVSGGGGKGMRRVDDPAALPAALAAARREARAAFGDERILVEKWIARPRHIEVQIFADRHGGVVHLFERDCSLQRRHQKVVEEAPAPDMPRALRAQMCEAAVQAARAIGYEGAGTCEFIVDVAAGLEEAPFYFMEMNTRLQVEHPVTEAVCGVDLVEWQLRVAAGEPLPRAQEALQLRGHALEVRLYAEDPERGYLPQTGRIDALTWPSGAGVRVDAGVDAGDEVSIHYDPLLAKLIAHGADRREALSRMARALAALRVHGVRTNAALLQRVVDHPAFAAGTIDTGFLDTHADALRHDDPASGKRALWVACAAELLTRARDRAAGSQSAWAATDAFRLHAPALDVLRLREDAGEHVVEIELVGDGFVLGSEGEHVRVRDPELRDGALWLTLDRQRQAYSVRPLGGVPLASGWEVWLEGRLHRFERRPEAVEVDAAEESLGALRAPMPGQVTAVLVEPGDAVDAGQALLRLTAMKMEHTLSAPAVGRVRGIHVRQGAQVTEGALLIELAALESESAPEGGANAG